jgi:cell division protease FtsH
MITDNRPNVTFKDVAGVDEAVEELQEVVEFLKERKKFIALGAKIPKGVLLVGPPGCGKTLLAKAIAGEANVPFFHMSGSDFVEMFVGVGASRVRDLFDQAKRSAPSIIFVDEIDAVGRQRGAGLGGGHDEREQTLNQLLVEMDGFDPNTGVILIAATNRPDILDPALLRPGRFDRRIVVDKPDVKGRVEILIIHTREIPLDEDVDLNVLARRTPGFAGSDLKNLANEAAILAAREGAKKVSMKHFDEAVDRVLAGPQRKSRIISTKEKEVIAYHEAGHAIVPFYLEGSDPVHKISILPRGMALGYTLSLPTEDRHIVTQSQLMNKLMELLGGRIAEEMVFNETSTGAQDDLEKGTMLARAMITEYGMSKKLGPLTFGRKHGAVFLGRDLGEERNYSEKIASQIDEEVRSLIEKAYTKSRQILEANVDKLHVVAKRLIEQEYLDGEQLRELLRDQPKLFDDDFTPLPPSGQEETSGTTAEAKEEVESAKKDKKLKDKGLTPEPA